MLVLNLRAFENTTHAAYDHFHIGTDFNMSASTKVVADTSPDSLFQALGCWGRAKASGRKNEGGLSRGTG